MTNKTIVVDYGIGNVFSVCNALKQLGAEAELTGSLSAILAADRVILPGVGAFARAMEALDAKGLSDTLRNYVAKARPFLGICIGMQVLMDRSTEFGNHQGLGLVSGQVERIADHGRSGNHLRIPHIGWADLQVSNQVADSWIGSALDATGKHEAVYFVHSYHCVPSNPSERLAFVDYDGAEVTAAIRRDNIVGVQFHPERSGVAGQKILQAFLHS